MTTKELKEELENKIKRAEENRVGKIGGDWDYLTGVIAGYNAVLMILRGEVK